MDIFKYFTLQGLGYSLIGSLGQGECYCGWKQIFIPFVILVKTMFELCQWQPGFENKYFCYFRYCWYSPGRTTKVMPCIGRQKRQAINVTYLGTQRVPWNVFYRSNMMLWLLTTGITNCSMLKLFAGLVFTVRLVNRLTPDLYLGFPKLIWRYKQTSTVIVLLLSATDWVICSDC
jgi:hypothetical protein